MYRKVSPSPETSSVSSRLRTPRSKSPSIDPSVLGQPACRSQHASSQHEPEQRKGEKHLPAEPHQLVITEPREGGTHPQKTKQHKRDLEREPDRARHPDEGWDPERSEPASEEEHGRHRTHQDHVAVFAEIEQREHHRRIFDKVAGHDLGLALWQVKRRSPRLCQRRDEKYYEHRQERDREPNMALGLDDLAQIERASA